MSHLQFLAVLGLLMDIGGTMVMYRYAQFSGGKLEVRSGLSGAALLTVGLNALLAGAGMVLVVFALVAWIL